MDSILNLSTLLVIVGVLMAITNVVVEVLKKATWDKLPTNIVVVIVAEVLTLTAGAAYAEIYGISILWFYVVAAIIVGLFVAYAAMFGFDKLQEVLNWKGKEAGKNE